MLVCNPIHYWCFVCLMFRNIQLIVFATKINYYMFWIPTNIQITYSWWLLILDDHVQSNCVFFSSLMTIINFEWPSSIWLCVYFYWLSTFKQFVLCRFVGPLMAAIYIFACLCDNAKRWHTFLHSTMLAVLLTQAHSLISTLLFEV